MFTGIIETTGIVVSIEPSGSNCRFGIESPLSGSLQVDQSIAHNGVCLTVEQVEDSRHYITAVDETLQKTNLGTWQPGTCINLERCLPINGRLDGHIVQGHVDGTGTCLSRIQKEGSWEFRFGFDASFAPLVIEKGSISLNGISLTVFNVGRSEFTVAIIPYTYEHTNMQFLEPGNTVNLEFDLLGKYVQRRIWLQEHR